MHRLGDLVQLFLPVHRRPTHLHKLAEHALPTKRVQILSQMSHPAHRQNRGMRQLFHERRKPQTLQIPVTFATAQRIQDRGAGARRARAKRAHSANIR